MNFICRPHLYIVTRAQVLQKNSRENVIYLNASEWTIHAEKALHMSLTLCPKYRVLV